MNFLKRILFVLKGEGVVSLVSKSIFFLRLRIRKIFAPLFLFIAFPRVRKTLSTFKSNDEKEIFNFISKGFFGIFAPMQIKEEFLEFLEIIKHDNISSLIEIGTAKGGALFCFIKLSKPDSKIISIDLPNGPFGGGYQEYKTIFFKMFGIGRKLHLIRGDSHSEQTRNIVSNFLGEQKIDLLFIDGDHTYEGTKKDFEMYKEFVRPGAKIVFHDIAPNGNEKYAGGVKFFWNEIKTKFPHKEIIFDKNQEGFGIGILYV